MTAPTSPAGSVEYRHHQCAALRGKPHAPGSPVCDACRADKREGKP